ncbi:MAG: hypothetical protein ACI4E3_00615 [Candidatus Fimousia sp.]|uniref:hypothetical protein n=1 Tax=Anaerostipes sp. 992a TaxID=1261637 RepID=UPI0011781AF6|nr:hypothetical protein [Anaerostipes sp. 992a]
MGRYRRCISDFTQENICQTYYEGVRKKHLSFMVPIMEQQKNMRKNWKEEQGCRQFPMSM